MPLLDFGLPDPRSQGLMAGGFKGMELSGPSLMPRSLGQIIGGAGGTGLEAMQKAVAAERANEQAKALIELEKQKGRLTEAQIAAMERQQQMAEDLMIKEGLLPPNYRGRTAPPAAPQAVPQAAPQIAPQPTPAGGIMPTGGPSLVGPGPTPQAAAPAPSQGSGLLGNLPPHLRSAAVLDLAMNGGKGLAGIQEKSLVSGPWGVGQWDPATQGYVTPKGLNEALSEQELAKAAGQTVDLPLGDGDKKITISKKSYLELQQIAPSVANNPKMIQALMAKAPEIIENPRKYAAVLRGGAVAPQGGFEDVVGPTGVRSGSASTELAPGLGQTQAQQIEQKRQESAARTSGEEDSKYVTELRKKLPALSGSMNRLDRMRERVAAGETFDAMGAEVKTTLGNLAISLGISKDQLPKVANSEQYLADLSELIKERLASKDYGSGSGVSNLDILTASQPLPQLVKTKQGKLQIIDAMKADMDRSYKDISAARDFYEKNNRSLEGFRFPSESIANPIPKTPGVPPGSSTPPAGAIQLLKMRPELKQQFDQKYGPGSAERALRGGS